MSSNRKFRYFLLTAGMICAFSLGRTQAQTEVYSWMFKNGDDTWQGAISGNRDENGKPWVRWESMPGADSIGRGMAFSAPTCDTNDFLYIYKAFAGLQPNSYYSISTLASFTVSARPDPIDQDIYLKVGATMSRPRVLASGKTNFSKGSGATSGKDLGYVGAIHTGTNSKEHRFFSQNYDQPVTAATNHEGELYLIIGLEPSKEMTSMPTVYLNTLRVLFDLVRQDSALARQDFKIDITATSQPNVFAYHIFPEESIMGFHVYSNEGHLIMVEEDRECVPDCPRIIDASMLEKGEYFVEFILMNQDRIVRKFKVK